MTRRIARTATAVALLAASAPANAAASGGAEVHVGFRPARVGTSTTVALDIRVGAAHRASAAPLTGIELLLPAGVSAGSSTLGTATCTAGTLRLKGPGGCPSNALMGHGNAVVAVPLGSVTITEHVAITIVMAPAVEEHTTMLFYADGTNPVISQLVFQGALLEGTAPFGAKLDTTIPAIAGLPGAPDVSLIELHTEIGPQGLRYFKHAHGRLVTYRPRGFQLGGRCPRGGYPVAAALVFADGSTETASSRTPCPRPLRP
ncbi:MAG: hypothetical protein ACLQBY_00170 [Solirubrobacteraceae bacterium]